MSDARAPRSRAQGGRSRAWSALVLVLGVSPAGAQAVVGDAYVKVLGKDDEEFARNLGRFGAPDLAEIVLGALEKRSGAGGSLRGELLRIELEQERARSEPDIVKRIALFEGFIESREEFARKHPGTPEAVQVQEGQLDLYRSVGEMILEALQQKDAVQDPAALAKHGIEILRQAAEKLELRIDELTALAKEPGLTPERQEELFVQRMVSAYGLARTRYFLALLYEPESFERTFTAKKALEVLLDFQLEYPDQLLCFEGYIYEGLCHKAIAQVDKALESFDAAIALRDTYEKSRSGVYDMAPDAAGIVSLAVQQKMLLLNETGDRAGAAAVAADFLGSTREPWRTLKGVAVLVLQAEAYQELGDQAAMTAAAKTLIEVDPSGLGGKRGRELLGGGGTSRLGALEIFKLAQSSAAREPERAIEYCQRALSLARGTADAADLGTGAGHLLGSLYAQRGALAEAAVVWEGVARRYPEGKEAPDCVWRVINCYFALQGQERRAVYEKLAQEWLDILSTRYPKSQYASMAGLIDGQRAEAAQDFPRAAQAYERIPAGSAGHEEGLYRAGAAWMRQARKLFQESNAAEAMEAVKRAETKLVKARAALEEAAGRTLETTQQDRLRAIAFQTRIEQANLYLMEGVGRAADVVPLFQGMDQELARDPARLGQVWELRFRALRAQNKLDEAIALFDAQLARDPGAVWLEVGAGALAPVLDRRAQELRAKDPSSSEADRLWSKTANYYRLAVQAQLEGRAPIRLAELEGVADRLFVFGLRLEGVPDTVETFAEWDKRLSNELIEAAARAYEAVLPQTPSYRTLIKLARTLGFLGRWDEAAARYAELFEREPFVDRVTNAIDPAVVAAKPELLFAYVELGVCEHQVGKQNNDTPRLLRAKKIFDALALGGSAQGSKLWWQSKFYLMQTMVDLGEYETVDAALDILQLNYEHFDDGKYGLERRFKELQSQLSKRVFTDKPKKPK